MDFTLNNDPGKKTKKYSYDYDQYYESGKGSKTMVGEILEDPEFANLTKLVIGCWGDPCGDDCQNIIDGIVAHADRFSHIKELFIGDMESEECELSWIEQGNYSKLWAAMPQLKALTIQGSTDLALGQICHDGLESLVIICGGLPESVIRAIQDAKLPNLKKLLLCIGIEDYGFDGNADTIKELLAKSDFPKLEYLGITDSEIQDEITEIILESKYIGSIETLDLSMGSLTDKGGALLLEKLPLWPNVKKLDAHYHYMSEEMEEKLKNLPIEVDVSDRNEPDEYRGQLYYYPMMTE